MQTNAEAEITRTLTLNVISDHAHDHVDCYDDHMHAHTHC